MPIYEFKCSRCGKKMEILIMNNETPKCIECGSLSLIRLFSTFNAHGTGKGSGGSSSCISCSSKNCSTCGSN